MPSFFGRKRRESTPASSTAPPPPPKDAKFHAQASTYSNPSTPHSQSLPAARPRHTSTPAYSRSNSLSYPSASSSSSSSSGTAGSPAPRPNARPSPPHRPVSSYTSQPRRPSPLSGPPLVAPSAPPTESSHSGSHSQTISKHEQVRPGGRWLSLTRRPRSEMLAPGHTGASTAETAEVTRPDAIQRSVSVVGDDWTRAYEAVEYDLEFHLDLDLDRRFSDKKTSGSRPSDERSRLRDAEDDSDDEIPGETDAMLGRDSETVQPTKKRAGLEERDHSPDKSALSSTRHARTPSAGWKAWSGGPDRATNTEASSSTPSATRTTPTLDTLPIPTLPASAAATSGTSNPAPVVSATTSSSHPTSLHSTPSSQSTPSLHSTLSSHSSSSQQRMSMSSHDKNAPLPPLPSPVRSPLLDRTQSKSIDPGSPLVAPPTPPKDSRAKIEEHVGPHVLADVQPQELGVAFPHLQGGASFLSSSSAPYIQTSPPPSSHHSPAASSLLPTDVPRGAAPTEPHVPSASVPIETSPQSTPSSSLASSSPALSQDQSSPPFLVLSYRGPPKTPTAVAPVAPPTPTHASSASAPPAGVLPLPLPTPGAAFAPPSGALPQPHDSHLPPTASSIPTSSAPPPPLSPSPRPSSVHFPSTVRSAAPSAPHPHPHNPRGSMILYHVSLPSSSSARPALTNAHTYQSFGRLSAHTNLGGMAVGEDGMLLPPPRSSNPPSPSSSAFNLLSSSGTHDAPAPPPANRYSSYSRNSTYSASADSVAAPSYSSTGPSSQLGLDDRDSKYAVGAMIGTVRSSHFQTLPRIGTPLAASFAFQDVHKGADADGHDGTADGGSVRASLAPEFTGGSIRGGGVIAYPYDPDEDDSDEEDGAGGYRGDWLHDPDVWPYADGADDFHARRGDWKWWSAARPRDKSPEGSLPKTDVEGVQMEMLGSTSISTTSRGSTSILKAPLQHPSQSRRGDGPHSYLPPYRPPTTLETVFGRGAASALSLFIIIAGLLALFIVYPITQVYGPEAGVAAKILGNTAINSTGQAVL